MSESTSLAIPEVVGKYQSAITAVRALLCKDATDPEITVFAQTCAQYGLNPFVGEIHWIPGTKGRSGRARVSRDGLFALAQRTGRYRGMNSGVVWLGDEWEWRVDDAVAHFHHVAGEHHGEGLPLGAWAMLWMKGLEHPLAAYAPWNAHAQALETQYGNPTTWRSHPAMMIRKAAETLVLQRAVGAELESVRELTVESLDDQAHAMLEGEAHAEELAITESGVVEQAAADARAALLAQIESDERILVDAEWDDWQVRPRRFNSRTKHAGTSQLDEAQAAGLERYAAHLTEIIEEMRAADAARANAALATPPDAPTTAEPTPTEPVAVPPATSVVALAPEQPPSPIKPPPKQLSEVRVRQILDAVGNGEIPLSIVSALLRIVRAHPAPALAWMTAHGHPMTIDQYAQIAETQPETFTVLSTHIYAKPGAENIDGLAGMAARFVAIALPKASPAAAPESNEEDVDDVAF